MPEPIDVLKGDLCSASGLTEAQFQRRYGCTKASVGLWLRGGAWPFPPERALVGKV